MSMIEIAECDACGQREDALSRNGDTWMPPDGWVWLIKNYVLLNVPANKTFLVCSQNCLLLAYGFATGQAKQVKKK